MVTKTITEQRAEVRIFAGNDPAHTATGSSGISSPTPALTPLMLDEATGKLVVWDGQKAGSAVGILVLPLEGTETALMYYKSGILISGLSFCPCGAPAIYSKAFSVSSSLSIVAAYMAFTMAD